MVNTFDAHIGYIIPTKCPTYSVIVKTEDNLHDIDASEHFLHVPVKVGIGESFMNNIHLKINAVSESDDFQAIPFCLWKSRPAYRTNYLGINVLSIIGANKNIMEENNVDWLGPTSEQILQIELSVEQEPNKSNISGLNPNYKSQCLVQDEWFFRLDRPDFDYKSKLWFVAYTLPPFNQTNRRGFQRMSYRMCNSIETLHHGNQEKYNFIKADNKIFSESQILFYKKIYNIWDWIYCMRMLKHYFWATYNSPR